MAGFGWSAGDLIEAFKFVVKISSALRESSGAASSYQESLDFLCALELTLQTLAGAYPLLQCDVHAALIQEQANAIRVSVKSFIDDIERFDKSLGAQRTKGFRHGTFRKVQWAVQVSKRVDKLRERISLPLATINTNVGLITLNSVSAMKTEIPLETKRRITAALEKDIVPQFRAKTDSINDTVITQSVTSRQSDATLHNAFACLSAQFKQDMQIMHSQVSRAERTHLAAKDRLEKAILVNTSELQAMQQSLVKRYKAHLHDRDDGSSSSAPWEELWKQATQCLLILVVCIHKLLIELITILAPQFKVYARSLQCLVFCLPKLIQSEHIRFEDVLGRKRYLPFEFFQSFNIINTFISEQFRGMPGEYKVATNQYILLEGSSGDIIGPHDWCDVIRPKTDIQMAVVLDQLPDEVATCPRCLYPALLFEHGAHITCSECGLAFFRAAFNGDHTWNTEDANHSDLASIDTVSIKRSHDSDETKMMSPGSEDLIEPGVAAGDFSSLNQRQEEIQHYRRVYIRVSDDSRVQAERLETWVSRSKVLGDGMLARFEAARPHYSDDDAYVNAVVDFDLLLREFTDTASRLVSLRSLFIEDSQDRFRVYIKVRFLASRLLYFTRKWTQPSRLRWTVLPRLDAISIIQNSSNTFRDIMLSISGVPSLTTAIEFLKEVYCMDQHSSLCDRFETLLSALGTFPRDRHSILGQIYSLLKADHALLGKFRNIISLADQQIFDQIECPSDLQMKNFANYQQALEYLHGYKFTFYNYEAFLDLLESYQGGPTVGFYQRLSDLLRTYASAFDINALNTALPALLTLTKTRNFQLLRRTPANVQRTPKRGNPWLCNSCGTRNSHMLTIGRCQTCGHIPVVDLNLDPKKANDLKRGLRWFKEWIGLVSPTLQLDFHLKPLERLKPYSEEEWKRRCEVDIEKHMEEYRAEHAE